MSIASPLALLFGSQTRVDVLTLFLMHPGESFYTREIASRIQQSPTPVVRELKKLEKIGFITSEAKANARYFSVNAQSPFFEELQSLIIKTSGIGAVIQNGLKKFSSLTFAFIYGSFATQEAGPASDIDLFLIGDVPFKELTKTIKEAEMKIKREVQFSIFPPKEFLTKLKGGNDFINQVVKGPKIMLIGEEDEFKRFSQGRMG